MSAIKPVVSVERMTHQSLGTCKQNSDRTNNILWSCNEKGKVRTFHNNRNDGRKTQQRETTREYDRWTCQLAGSRQGG